MIRGDYSAIAKAFWRDPDIRTTLRPEHKTLLLYYFSSPHSNPVGVYYCPYDYAARETGLDPDDVRLWTNTVLTPWVTYDEQTEEVWVHKAGRHQIAETLKASDKRRNGIERDVRSIQSPYLQAHFLDRYEDWSLDVERPEVPENYNRLGRALRERVKSTQIEKGHQKTLMEGPEGTNTEQNKTEQNKTGSTSSSLRSSDGASPDVENSGDVENSDEEPEQEPPDEDNGDMDWGDFAGWMRTRGCPDYLWQGGEPHGPNGSGDPWTVARELDICRKLQHQGNRLETIREVVKLVPDRTNLPPPVTMRLFWQRGERQRWNELKAVALRKMENLDRSGSGGPTRMQVQVEAAS